MEVLTTNILFQLQISKQIYEPLLRFMFLDLQNEENVGEDTSDDESINEEVETRNRKKQLTKNRLVNSIDTALDLDNYNMFPIAEEKMTKQGEIKDGKDSRKIVFVNQPSNQRNSGRQASHNIISGNPGVSAVGKAAETELDHLKLFLTDAMFTEVLTSINNRINKVIEELPEDTSDKYTFLKPVGMEELLAFFGLFYYRALWQQNKMSIRTLYSETGPSIYGATMARDRFQFLLKHLSFDDPESRQERWRKDRFAAFRDFFRRLQCPMQNDSHP